MIITLTLILASLVALNFLLLTFSCNKVTKKTAAQNQLIITKPKSVKVVKPTERLATNQLAPTGS
ncbi:hypothetical protein [Psychroserpens algicola]|uniref:Uncharacterized protein n=1 Tax=Psychroserpens algicola TaxID=1719034 RepID=A0ABT0H9G1_9FLAO|nr:hypothetical protein [Psychroserpens algicola]MCK8480639.1 hypothetical protein [Psychroserpens algicola]